jgi:hypothetical protein
VVGDTPNPHYDSAYAWSQEYLRTYPSDWDGKAGQDLDPLYCAIRNDDTRRLCMGRFLADNMELSGIPCDKVEKSMAGHYGRVMGSFDYHFYTGGWSLDRFPLNQYNLYHSGHWYCWSPNYVTGVDKNGNPNYPDLDAVLDELYYCPDMAASMSASQKAQGLLVEKYCICLWGYSAAGFWAYRNLLGVCNMDGYSLDNDYTFLNMRTIDGTRPTVGIITPPYQQNVLMSSWFYDRQVMDRTYGASAGISIAPYALARDQPWVIQDWSPDVWVDPEDGKTKTVVTVWFRENVKWISPVTGAVYGTFTAHDFMFSEWLIAGHTKAWTHDKKLPIHHIKIIDDYCVQVFMESESYWLQYVGDYVVNKALWQGKFCMINTTTVVLDQDYVACDKLWLRPYITGVGPGKWAGQILQMVDCTLDGVTLIEDIDYEIVMLGDDHSYFHWLRPASTGQVLTVVYWTIDPAKDPDGYWPGEYDWDEIAVGLGTHYYVDYLGGAGGYAALKANDNFWLETPVPDPEGVDACSPLPGEVNWMWEWGPRDTDRPLGGPRCGHYKVDTSDVAMCTSAMGSRGNGEPDPGWFAGADLALPECYIDIADANTITGRFGKTFGGWSQPLTCPPVGVHDIAVMNVATSKSGCPGVGNGVPCPVLCQNRTAKVNVTVRNKGEFTESFDVTVYADESVIQTYTVTDLASGGQETRTVIWNATGWAKGNYTIKAVADQVTGEIDLGDNTFTDKWIMVVHPGDLDNSGEVDITDVVMVTGIYRAKIGDPEYNACRDVVEDGVIDISDVVAVTGHYREKDP